MRHQIIAAAATALLGAVPAMAAPPDLPINKATTVNGIEVACTGIGSAEDDPQWATYPLKIVAADSNGEYEADEVITVFRDKTQLLSAHCGGPWLLLKLAPGRYGIAGVLLGGGSATTTATVPAKGHGRAVLRFRAH